VPLLGFMPTFCTPSLPLIVEVDDGYHARRASADARRDCKLMRLLSAIASYELKQRESNAT